MNLRSGVRQQGHPGRNGHPKWHTRNGYAPLWGVQAETSTIPAKVTIFADGANSLVRGIMPTMRNPRELALGLDQLLEAPNIGESSRFEVRFGSFALGWRAQLNPVGGDHARLWTFARGIPSEELGACADRARWAFLKGERVRILEERRGADPALVMPGQITEDGVMACAAAAGQGGLEYGACAGLIAGRVAAHAVRVGDISRHALRPYERAWRRGTMAQTRALRWGMASLRRLSDTELDSLFVSLSEIEFGKDDLLNSLRGDPRSAVQKVGTKRLGKAFLELVRGWSRILVSCL